MSKSPIRQSGHWGQREGLGVTHELVAGLQATRAGLLTSPQAGLEQTAVTTAAAGQTSTGRGYGVGPGSPGETAPVGSRPVGHLPSRVTSRPLWDQWLRNTVTKDGNSGTGQLGQIGREQQGCLALFPRLERHLGSLGLGACPPTPAPLCACVPCPASSHPLLSAPQAARCSLTPLTAPLAALGLVPFTRHLGIRSCPCLPSAHSPLQPWPVCKCLLHSQGPSPPWMGRKMALKVPPWNLEPVNVTLHDQRDLAAVSKSRTLGLSQWPRGTTGSSSERGRRDRGGAERTEATG